MDVEILNKHQHWKKSSVYSSLGVKNFDSSLGLEIFYSSLGLKINFWNNCLQSDGNDTGARASSKDCHVDQPKLSTHWGAWNQVILSLIPSNRKRREKIVLNFRLKICMCHSWLLSFYVFTDLSLTLSSWYWEIILAWSSLWTVGFLRFWSL